MSEYDGVAKASNADSPFELENIYSESEMAGIIAIISAASLSAVSVIIVVVVMTAVAGQRWRQHHFRRLVPVLVSLLLSDLLQAIGSIMNAHWIAKGAVRSGGFCTAQGAVKQTGNVAVAVWTLMSAVHAFQVLFKRGKSSLVGVSLQIGGGWTAVLLIVTIGPLAVQSKNFGPFYDVTGLWCWITSEYPKSQIFLEYFWGWLSAGLSFILYTLTYIRVRGNLTRRNGKWAVRRLPDEEWLVSVQRDVLDAAMHRLASALIWFPIAETLILVPISLARLLSWSGAKVPFAVTVMCAVIFNLTGFIDSILLILISRRLPDAGTLPALTTTRAKTSANLSKTSLGVTPYMFAEAPVEGGLSRQTSRATTWSGNSLDSDASRDTLVDEGRV